MWQKLIVHNVRLFHILQYSSHKVHHLNSLKADPVCCRLYWALMFKIVIFWYWMLNKMSCTTWGPDLKMFRKVAELGSWTTLCALFEDVMFPKHISNLPICLGNITRKYYYKCFTGLLRSLIGVYYFEVNFKIYEM